MGFRPQLVYVAGQLPDAVVTSVDGVLQGRAQRQQFDVWIEQPELGLELARVVSVDVPARERLGVHRVSIAAQASGRLALWWVLGSENLAPAPR